MANANCLWRRSKSPMQSNLPSFSFPPVSFTIIVYLFCRTPHYVFQYTNPRYQFAASVNSFCHALSGAKHYTPPVLPQLLRFSTYLYFSRFSFSRLKRYLCHTNRISPLYALAYTSILLY